VTRVPVVATAIVALAIATMLALGVWQLRRVGEKDALIAQFRANATRPAIAFPALAPVPAPALFRRSSALCLTVVGWRSEAGRTASGSAGYRLIAECWTGAEGPGLLAQMGVRPGMAANPTWRGGPVAGVIVTEPDHRSILARAIGKDVPLRPMLVADTPLPGLAPNARPDPADIPNNHRAYAVQWFIFAGLAGVIYALAVRGRARRRSD
jgi:surfeit locus 1 family protein